jgi:hypothetical protein
MRLSSPGWSFWPARNGPADLRAPEARDTVIGHRSASLAAHRPRAVLLLSSRFCMIVIQTRIISVDSCDCPERTEGQPKRFGGRGGQAPIATHGAAVVDLEQLLEERGVVRAT